MPITSAIVYGTLRPGEGNHRIISSTVCTARDVTVPGFSLYRDHGFPYAWPDAPTQSITGTHVTFHPDDWAESLHRMDLLEGVDHGHYTRIITAGHDEDGCAWFGWIYLPTQDPRQHHSRILSGDWKNREHANQTRLNVHSATHVPGEIR